MSGGALDAAVTLDEVLAAVGAKRVALAAELAGYLVLEIAESADPNGGAVDPKCVFVGEEGTVALIKTKRAPASGDAEASVRATLGRLLEAGGSQTPALAAASKRRNGAGLAALAEELHAALIPINRSAGRRALARLGREVKRATPGVGRQTLSSALPANERSAAGGSSSSNFSKDEDPTTLHSRLARAPLRKATPANWSEMPTTQFTFDPSAPSPSEDDVDSLIAKFGASGGTEQQQTRALKAIAGLDATPPAPPDLGRGLIGPKPAAGGNPPPVHAALPPVESDVEALLGMDAEAGRGDLAPPEIGVRAPTAMPTPMSAPSRGSLRGAANERQLPTQPSQPKKARSTLPSVPLASSRAGGSLVILAIVAVGVGSYAVWRLRPDSLVRRVSSPAESTPMPPREAQSGCIGTLVVADVPPRAEVLVHEGQAPLDIPRMPIGARLEFVATAEGYAPKRVVVPAGAGWDPGPDGKPRFEAAVQLDPSHARAGEPWPPGEPGSAVGGDGPPGTVRVIATPRGAEVWMLAGIAPDARIEHLRCDDDFDVLLAGPTTYRKRLHVSASDFVPDATERNVRLARVSGK